MILLNVRMNFGIFTNCAKTKILKGASEMEIAALSHSLVASISGKEDDDAAFRPYVLGLRSNLMAGRTRVVASAA